MDDYVKWPAAAALACATALGLLALLTYGAGTFHHLDLRVFLELSNHRPSRADEWAQSLAKLMDLQPMLGFLAAACGIALLRGRPIDALAAVAVVAGANVTTQVLKALLSHPRAQTLLGGSGAAEVGFPSGHTTAAFSIAIAYAFALPRSIAPTVLFVGVCFGLAVGFSVVMISWHYPSDVIGGILVASAWGFAVLAAVRAWEPRGAEVRSAGPLPSR